ncbi:MAG: hypothetical protein R6V04_07815, partial [bacterium]
MINFDLGTIKNPKNFSLGTYDIIIKDKYEELHKKLKNGYDICTANVYVEKEEKSLLLTKKNKSTAIYDICLILSFFTGRRVFLDSGIKYFSTFSRLNPILYAHDLVDAVKIAWENRQNFSSDEERRILWLYINILETCIMENFGLFACIAAEIIQRVEVRKDNFKPPKEFELFIEKLQKFIDNSELCDVNLKNRLKGSVGNWSSCSSIEGFKQLLSNYNIIRLPIEDDVKERICYINGIRNDLAHGLDIRKPTWEINHDPFIESCYVAHDFLPNLIRLYLIKKFKLS